MRISAVQVRDFKRVRSVAIKPDADRVVILIGGKNAAGKSSVLDALTTAFGGKRAAPIDPVRHGADEAAITVELDAGALTIHRVIEAGGESRLEVREKGNVIRAPQERLNKLVATRFLDPIAFLQLSAAEQREQLLSMFDRDGAIAKLEEHRERIFAKRTEVGRDLKKAEGELARLPHDVEVSPAIDVVALNEEVRQLAELQRKGDGLANLQKMEEREVERLANEHTRALEDVAKLEKQLAAAQDRAGAIAAQGDAAFVALSKTREKVAAVIEEWQGLAARREQLDADLKRAGEHNRAVFEAEASNKRRAAAAETVKLLEAQREQQTELLEKIERQKVELLAAAKLPADGLGIASDGITLNGVPFAQASAAERLRVALALAMAAAPDLDDIWVRDGALLDDDHLQLIADMAEQAGRRVWIERVGDRDPGAIVIQDGTVRAEARRAAG